MPNHSSKEREQQTPKLTLVAEGKQFEQHNPHALMVSIRDPSTKPPRPMFLLSKIRYNPKPLTLNPKP